MVVGREICFGFGPTRVFDAIEAILAQIIEMLFVCGCVVAIDIGGIVQVSLVLDLITASVGDTGSFNLCEDRYPTNSFTAHATLSSFVQCAVNRP